jgi:hypothetical protein
MAFHSAAINLHLKMSFVGSKGEGRINQRKGRNTFLAHQTARQKTLERHNGSEDSKL